MTQLVEANVGEDRERHEEDERCVEQNQPSLSNVSVVEEHQAGCEDASWKRVSTLPHNPEDSADCECSLQCRKRAVSHIGHLVGDVAVANVLEQELSLVSHKPACESEEEFAEWWMNVEEVGAIKVVGCKLCKAR